MQPPQDLASRELVSLLTRHQRQILSYIYTLVPRHHDAEDLLQETCLLICDRFSEFEPGSDFLAWACRIAWWQVRKARQRHARRGLLTSETLLNDLAATALEMTAELDARHETLQHCLGQLTDRDRQTVLTRYEPDGSVKAAAEASGRTVPATYKALFRIRQALFQCITRRLDARARTWN